MNILAIDSTSEHLTLALATNAQVHTHQVRAGSSHSQLILPAIHELLTMQQLSAPQLNLIAYNQGPGSFTGLRIGLSTALGLAYATNCQLLAIPAFNLYLTPAIQNYEYLAILLDARMGQIYVAVIRSHDHSYVLEPTLANPIEVATLLNSQAALTTSNCVLTGAGFSQHQAELAAHFTHQFDFFEQPQPPAKRMLELAQTAYFKPCSAFEAELLYVRNKVALNLTEQQQAKHQ